MKRKGFTRPLFFKKNKGGFTILELVLVLVILATLATLIFYSLAPVRQANRDAKRLADVQEAQATLGLFYHDWGVYPAAATPGQPVVSGAVTYLLSWPANPAPRNDGSCPDAEYTYQSISSGASYSLAFCLSAATGDVGPGTSFAIPGHIITCAPNCVLSCSSGSDGCGGTCSNTITCPSGYTCTNDHCIKD